MKSSVSVVALSIAILMCALTADAFPIHRRKTVTARAATTLAMVPENQQDSKPKNFLDDLKGMFSSFDDVVDDFFMKRMGAGEQWYGKRKYNPSGNHDGNYNGMGRSDYHRIESARVQKEEIEMRRQLRRLEEEAKQNNKN